jgi:Mrp family chromosome partitioning ATPase
MATAPDSLASTAGFAEVVEWFEQQRAGLANPSLAVVTFGAEQGEAAAATVAMARLLASRGKRIIVVDVSAANTGFADAMAVAPGPGLTDLIIGAADFTRVIVRDQHSTAHVLRYGQIRNAQAATMLGDRFKPVMQALVPVYDTVIVHCGEAVAATPVLIRSCGATVFLAPGHRSPDVALAIATLKATGYATTGFVQIAQSPAAHSAPEYAKQAVNA